MIPAKRSLIFAVISFLLFTSAALNARAQNLQPTPAPPSRITINPNDRIIVTPNDKVIIDSNRYSIIPPNSITGKIRWRTEYGLPYNSYNDGRPVYPYPCGSGVFFLRPTTLVINERPGQTPQGSYQDVGNLTGDPTLSDAGIATTGGIPRQEGEYYVCRYAIVNLPLNRAINLALDINPGYLPANYTGFDRSIRLTAPWVGGSQPQPPPGYQRTIKGNRSVTLTDNAPRATVDFEIVYEPIPGSGR